MRLHFFEFEDLAWFPQNIRSGGTDYLRYFLNNTRFYEPVIPLLNELLPYSEENKIIDLCSGGGGNIELIASGINRQNKKGVRILLTDKYPNLASFRYISDRSGGTIEFKEESVDVTKVPPDLKGVRTIFSAAHHFKEKDLEQILNDAVKNRSPIAIFDGGDRNLLMIIGLLIVHPLLFLLLTPVFRPFKSSRFIFTYLLPLIPLMTIWDGIISIIRLYSP
jgi:hypothetical protein